MEKDKRDHFLRLSWHLAIVDFNLKNERNYLGNLWYLLNPLFLFLVLFLIFADRLGGAIPSYPSYLVVGILMFNFFVKTTTESTGAILGNNVIKSFSFKKEALVLSVILRNIFSHIFEAIVFFVILLFLGVPWYGIFIYIPFLFFLTLFVYGVALFLSAVTVYFTDLGNIWQFFMTILWFGTPIFYAIGEQTRLFLFNLLNPLYYFITAARDSIIYAKIPEPWILAGIVVYPLLAFIIGNETFKKLKHKFADML